MELSTVDSSTVPRSRQAALLCKPAADLSYFASYFSEAISSYANGSGGESDALGPRNAVSVYWGDKI